MIQNPFETIESTHEYMRLLEKMLEEVQETVIVDLEGDALVEASGSRGLDGLRLVNYKLDQLRQHVRASSRILNDLRTLRRLLLLERDRARGGSESPADANMTGFVA